MLQIPLAYMGPWPVLETCSIHLLAFNERTQYVFRDPGFALFEGGDSIFTLRNRRFMSQVRRTLHFARNAALVSLGS